MPLAVDPPHYHGDTAARLRLLLTLYQGAATDAAIESAQPNDAAAGRAFERVRLLYVAAVNLESLLVAHAWHDIDPAASMSILAGRWYVGTPRTKAWLQRVADHASAWLSGQEPPIPESADLCEGGEERGR